MMRLHFDEYLKSQRGNKSSKSSMARDGTIIPARRFPDEESKPSIPSIGFFSQT
jgi:hypothetical protein